MKYLTEITQVNELIDQVGGMLDVLENSYSPEQDEIENYIYHVYASLGFLRDVYTKHSK